MKAASQHALFDRDGWWDPANRAFASLQRVSAFRLQLLDAWLGDQWRGRDVVDLGCGGGLLGVPLAQRGARVVGFDIAPAALRAAQQRRQPGFLGVVGEMQHTPMPDASTDLALLADVLEHVDEPAAAVAEAARLLRPGGHLFVNTIDRTIRSRLFAIWLGEGLGYIPKGTHQWSMFLRPVELDRMTRDAGLRRVRITGEAPKLLATLRQRAIVMRESRSLAVGYAALFEKAR